MKRIICAVIFAVGVCGADLSKGEFGAARTDAVNISSAAAEKPKAKRASRNSYPFHGTLDSIDAEKRTITLKGKKKNRVILLSAETRFFRSGVKAARDSATPGERVTGTVRKNSEGREVAVTVRLGGTQREQKPRINTNKHESR